MHIFLVLSAFFISNVLSLPSMDDGEGFRRSDLFLEEPYFLGIPNVKSAESFGLDDYYDSGLTNDLITIQRNLKIGRDKIKVGPKSSNWSSRVTKLKLQNAGSDVVKAYKENMKNQRERIQTLDANPTSRSIHDEINQCEKNCHAFDILSEKYVCILECATKNKGPLSQVSVILYYGIKTLCHTVGTFYTKFDKLNVKNLQTFQAIMNEIEAPMPVSSNIPLRSMLARIIKDIFSTMTPFRPMLNNFEADMAALENSLNLKANILVGANPGCSMVDMNKYIEAVVSVISKEPSLTDYIMLQGYALFTALSKYVDEFPTKKRFSVLTQGLDMLLGTTCGLFMYGAAGETSNCDQIGGYPVLNMPVPEFMWPDDVHLSCQKAKEKMSEKKLSENAQRKREAAVVKGLLESDSVESGATEELEMFEMPVQRRRRRSLVVGGKLVERKISV